MSSECPIHRANAPFIRPLQKSKKSSATNQWEMARLSSTGERAGRTRAPESTDAATLGVGNPVASLTNGILLNCLIFARQIFFRMTDAKERPDRHTVPLLPRCRHCVSRFACPCLAAPAPSRPNPFRQRSFFLAALTMLFPRQKALQRSQFPGLLLLQID